MTPTRITDRPVKSHRRRNRRRRDHNVPRTAAQAAAEAEAWELRATLLPDGDPAAIVAAFKKTAYWSGKAAYFAKREAALAVAAEQRRAARRKAIGEMNMAIARRMKNGP